MAIPPWPSKCPQLDQSSDDIWGHFGVILEVILGTVGVFFDACRLQEPKKEGSGGHSCFHLPQGAQEGSRCSWSSIFTLTTSGKECGLLAPFWRDFGSQKLNYTHFGVSLSRFWVAPWGVILKVTFCGLPGAGRILRTCLVEGNWARWGP